MTLVWPNRLGRGKFKKKAKGKGYFIVDAKTYQNAEKKKEKETHNGKRAIIW